MFCDLVDSTGIAAQLDDEEWRDLVSAYLDAASTAVSKTAMPADRASRGLWQGANPQRGNSQPVYSIMYSPAPLQSVQYTIPFLSANTSAECRTTGRFGLGSISFFGAGGTQAPTSTG
jgi:hypothetical protein